jgi:hypothetical protein
MESTHQAPAPAVAEPAVAAPAPAALPTLALTPAALLALQRSAGNRAVGALLARDAAPTDAGKPQTTEFSVLMPSIGTIPVLSYQFSLGKRRPEDEEAPKEGKPGAKPDPGPPGEIKLVSEEGPHSAALMRESLDGRAQDVVVTAARGGASLKLRCQGALVSSYSISPRGEDRPPLETWTLNCAAIKSEFTKDEKE